MRSFLLSVGGLFLASGIEDELSLLQGHIQAARRSSSGKKGQKGALPEDPEPQQSSSSGKKGQKGALPEDPEPQQIYGGTQMTVNGCSCQSECRTDTEFHCHVAEVCLVDDNYCEQGQQHPTKEGFYDWCEYPAFQDYEQLSAQQKHTLLLSKADDDTDFNSPIDYPDVVADARLILNRSVWLNFDANSDIYPIQHEKTIHSVGVVGGIKFTSSGNHSYQGIFRGAEYGIIRLSAGTQPTETGFQMSTAVKFMRDGRRSANILADRKQHLMKDANVSDFAFCGENDFQDAEWSNHLEFGNTGHPNVSGLSVIGPKFLQVSNCPLMLGLSDAASNAEGEPAQRGSFPFQVTYKRADQTKCDCANYGDCLANWAMKPVGTKMFNVEAVATPGAAAQHIGEIFLTSKMTRSKWGDEKLFFQHQSMEEDFGIHPEWLTDPTKADCGPTGPFSPLPIQPGKDQGCVPLKGTDPVLHVGAVPLKGTNPSGYTCWAQMLSTDPGICS